MHRLHLGLLIVVAIASFGCDGDTSPLDADVALDATCSDATCDDGEFCNGVEVCREGACASGTPPCAAAACDEAADSCGGCEVSDADADGSDSIACGGADCDDDDANRFPGNTEICDSMDRDEDCDDRTFGVRDADGDGAPDALCCNGTTCGDDCDDSRAGVGPNSSETCDGRDNDCDGLVDEGVTTVWTVDGDGDGYGSDASDAATMTACARPPGYAELATDCDDGDGAENPGNAEVCDAEGKDENCSGVVNENCACSAPSSRPCTEGGLVGRCASGTQMCDGLTGMWGACSIVPVTEICNGEDDDCNGNIDDGVAIACYADPDRDGYASSAATVTMRCACGADETTRAPIDETNTDCREAPETWAAQSYPGAVEQCDGLDNDCGNASDRGGVEIAEDRDGDQYTAEGFSGCVGGPFEKSDCADFNSDINPGHTDYESTPYCTSGILCNCAGTQRCLTPSVGSLCPVCASPSSGTAPTFDWNCSGVTEVEPRLTSCSGSCCGGGRCGPNSNHSIGSCGNNVAYSCCFPGGGSTCASGCGFGSGGTRGLGCR